MFLLLLIFHLYFLFPSVIAQSFNSTVELVIPKGIQIREAKSEMEKHPVIAETEISKCLK